MRKLTSKGKHTLKIDQLLTKSVRSLKDKVVKSSIFTTVVKLIHKTKSFKV